MVRAVLTMVIREGCEAAFVEAWKTAMKDGNPPGSLGQTLMSDPGRPRRYIITGDWESKDALREFESSPQRRAMSAAFDPLRVPGGGKSVLDIIARV